MKNPEKLAASKKKPKYPVYEEGGRIVWITPGTQKGGQLYQLPAVRVAARRCSQERRHRAQRQSQPDAQLCRQEDADAGQLPSSDGASVKSQ